MLWKDAEKFCVANPEGLKGMRGCPGGPEELGEDGRETGTQWG